jgi:hypothetical protein
MAKRPIFEPLIAHQNYLQISQIDFEWFPGFSITQKRKSIRSLHQAFLNKNSISGKILEVSTKSENPLGVKLSAFRLSSFATSNTSMTVEEAYQKGKRFSDGYLPDEDSDIRQIKAENRNHQITGFKFANMEFPTHPESMFYDYIYWRFLYENPNLVQELIEGQYMAFSDIEFNPNRSISSQARSVAIFVSLYHRGCFENASFFNRDQFISFYINEISRQLV